MADWPGHVSSGAALIGVLAAHGADIEASGAAFTGGTAMSDAVMFGRWKATLRLLARGATTTIWQAVACERGNAELVALLQGRGRVG